MVLKHCVFVLHIIFDVSLIVWFCIDASRAIEQCCELNTSVVNALLPMEITDVQLLHYSSHRWSFPS